MMFCIGHRGAMGHAPENTLASIDKALEMRTPFIEVDVYFVDGKVVVFHDQRLERTTNGYGYIVEQKFDYLRTLDAGNGEIIPTLEEVLDLIDKRAGINIELKGDKTAEPVIKLIGKYRNLGWENDLFLVSSFNHRQLEKCRLLDSEIKIGALIVGLPTRDAEFAEKLGAYSVHPCIDFVDSRFVEDAHSRNLRVFVFTINHIQDVAKVQRLGVDGLFTNFPELVLSKEAPVDIDHLWR